MKRIQKIATALLFLGASAMIGCDGGDGLDRQAVSGNVTYNGQPLENGTISFLPDDPAMKDPIMGGSPIQDGSYAIDTASGLVPGKYKVTISSASSERSDAAPGSASDLAKELIPSKYNTASTLTAEVKAGESNTFDFKLED